MQLLSDNLMYFGRALLIEELLGQTMYRHRLVVRFGLTFIMCLKGEQLLHYIFRSTRLQSLP